MSIAVKFPHAPRITINESSSSSRSLHRREVFIVEKLLSSSYNYWKTIDRQLAQGTDAITALSYNLKETEGHFDHVRLAASRDQFRSEHARMCCTVLRCDATAAGRLCAVHCNRVYAEILHEAMRQAFVHEHSCHMLLDTHESLRPFHLQDFPYDGRAERPEVSKRKVHCQSRPAMAPLQHPPAVKSLPIPPHAASLISISKQPFGPAEGYRVRGSCVCSTDTTTSTSTQTSGVVLPAPATRSPERIAQKDFKQHLIAFVRLYHGRSTSLVRPGRAATQIFSRSQGPRACRAGQCRPRPAGRPQRGR
ncbi:hypothetical protein MRB53_038659 [Persea americana]|nr:hypothetical protein MRB53_038659 [Persea americana]